MELHPDRAVDEHQLGAILLEVAHLGAAPRLLEDAHLDGVEVVAAHLLGAAVMVHELHTEVLLRTAVLLLMEVTDRARLMAVEHHTGVPQHMEEMMDLELHMEGSTPARVHLPGEPRPQAQLRLQSPTFQLPLLEHTTPRLPLHSRLPLLLAMATQHPRLVDPQWTLLLLETSRLPHLAILRASTRHREDMTGLPLRPRLQLLALGQRHRAWTMTLGTNRSSKHEAFAQTRCIL